MSKVSAKTTSQLQEGLESQYSSAGQQKALTSCANNRAGRKWLCLTDSQTLTIASAVICLKCGDTEVSSALIILLLFCPFICELRFGFRHLVKQPHFIQHTPPDSLGAEVTYLPSRLRRQRLNEFTDSIQYNEALLSSGQCKMNTPRTKRYKKRALSAKKPINKQLELHNPASSPNYSTPL